MINLPNWDRHIVFIAVDIFFEFSIQIHHVIEVNFQPNLVVKGLKRNEQIHNSNHFLEEMKENNLACYIFLPDCYLSISLIHFEDSENKWSFIVCNFCCSTLFLINTILGPHLSNWKFFKSLHDPQKCLYTRKSNAHLTWFLLFFLSFFGHLFLNLLFYLVGLNTMGIQQLLTAAAAAAATGNNPGNTEFFNIFFFLSTFK